MKLRFAAMAAIATLSLSSCGSSDSAKLSGSVEGLTSGKVVVKVLNLNKMDVLDTLTLDANGAYNVNVPVKKTDPEFVYVYYGSRKVASLILAGGDKVKVTSDTLGNYSVAGSPESEKLLEVEKAQSEFLKGMAGAADQADLSRLYINYYRKRIRFTIENNKSLSCVPVLMETIGQAPVFSQRTDAIHFRNVCDSLKTVYPESRYVKSLEAETVRRENVLQLSGYMENAKEIGYIDIALNDVNGKKVALSDVAKNKKVVMVYFWASTMERQAIFNLDVLKPVYKQFAPKGFEIYAISLDVDKAAWATTLKSQSLGWVNVCDGLGVASPVITTYNVQSVPSLFFIINGEVVSGTGVKNEATLRSFLSSKLR